MSTILLVQCNEHTTGGTRITLPALGVVGDDDHPYILMATSVLEVHWYKTQHSSWFVDQTVLSGGVLVLSCIVKGTLSSSNPTHTQMVACIWSPLWIHCFSYSIICGVQLPTNRFVPDQHRVSLPHTLHITTAYPCPRCIAVQSSSCRVIDTPTLHDSQYTTYSACAMSRILAMGTCTTD